MATTISLTGRLADVMSRPVDSINSVTVKAPSYRPGPGVELTTSQPMNVQLSGDGAITINVVEGVGWLYVEGDGWSDSIRFVAAAGMTTVWEAVVNALPIVVEAKRLLWEMGAKYEEYRASLVTIANDHINDMAALLGQVADLKDHVDSVAGAIDTAFTDSIPPYLQQDSPTGLNATYVAKDDLNQYRAYETPEMYGGKGDGTTDDAGAIQAAINAARISKKTVLLAGVTYRVGTPIQVFSGVHVTGTSGTVINTTYKLTSAFFTRGEFGTDTNVTASVRNGDTFVKVNDASLFEVGGYARFVSQRNAVSSDSGEYWGLGTSTSADSPVYYGEYSRVNEVDLVASAITLDSPLLYPTYASNSEAETDPLARPYATISQVSFASDIVLENFTIRGYDDRGIDIHMGRNVVVRNITYHNNREGGDAVVFRGSWNCRAVGCAAFYTYPTWGGRYAARNAFKSISSQNCGFIECYCENGTQPFDITFDNDFNTPSTACYVINCDTLGAKYHGAVVHGGCMFPVIKDNRFVGCNGSGIGNRGRSAIIQGNIVEGDGNDGVFGIAVYESGAVDTLVQGNQVNGFSSSVILYDADVDSIDRDQTWVGLRVQGNVLRLWKDHGVWLRRSRTTFTGDTGIFVDGNNILGGLTGSNTYNDQAMGVRIDGYVNGVVVQNNTIDLMNAGYSRGCVVALANVSTLFVSGNIFKNSAGDGLQVEARTDTMVPHPVVTLGVGNKIIGVARFAFRIPTGGSSKMVNDYFQGTPKITGSKSGNTALSSLLTQLASLGLIIDQTT